MIPDSTEWERAWAFLIDGRVSTEGALAVAVILCWAVLAALLAVAAFLLLLRAHGTGVLRRRRVRAVLWLVIGVLALASGVLHHRGAAYSMCCGGDPSHLQEARDLVR